MLASIRSASLFIKMPRSVAGSNFQAGLLRAARALLTAMSTSSGPAAWTVAISVSSLQRHDQFGRTTSQDLQNVRCIYACDGGSGLGVHKLIVDEQAQWLLVLLAIGSSKVHVKV